MLTKQRKPFNTSTKILRPIDSVTKEYDGMSKSRLQKIMSQEELKKKFTQLYHESEKWQAKKEKMRQERKIIIEEKEMQGCTFVPQINPEKQQFVTKGSGSFLRRQNDWVLKKEKKIKELESQSEKKKTKECSFHPKISKKSYSLLFKSENSDRKQYVNNNNNSTQQVRQLSTSRSIASSYRLIHEKKDSYHQLRKASSFKGFTLMTEKRYLQRLQLQSSQNPTPIQTHSMYDLAREQLSFSTINNESQSTQKHNHQTENDNYIENIVINNTEEQDSLNSLQSIQMKSDKKHQNNSQVIKCQISEQADEESLENVETEECEMSNDENNQKNNQHDEQYSYDQSSYDANRLQYSHNHPSSSSSCHQKGTNLQIQLIELQQQNQNSHYQ